jgi:Protein of unknown function (DUF1631)
MPSIADHRSLALQARRLYADRLAQGLPAIGKAVLESTHRLNEQGAEHAVAQRRRDLLHALVSGADRWQKQVVVALRQAAQGASLVAKPSSALLSSAAVPRPALSLVDDDTIEREILTSRLALAMMDRATWEFSDLRSRMSMLEDKPELDPQDLLRAHVLARLAVDSWRQVDLTLDGWRDLQNDLHQEFASLAEEAYHEVNHWLLSQKVLPEVDLRPFVRKTRSAAWPQSTASGPSTGLGHLAPSTGTTAHPTSYHGSLTPEQIGRVNDETRLMTRSHGLARPGDHASAVLDKLNRLVGRHLPGFGRGATGPQHLSPALSVAINAAQDGMRQRASRPTQPGEVAITTPELLAELHQRKRQLKALAGSAEERATIEIVALLFQSILTEERIPPAVRIWFARLQMPVLRVAVSEPDFFATMEHPARRLIDRMGSCVMGFDGDSSGVSNSVEREIKRVVQVVEAYPDTGRRVFQTVLTEFEKFLAGYLPSRNEATRKAVSLAQQVEQRETLAIQFTIELRRMLDTVPVQDGIRQFLFHVWADVLATAAVRHGAQSEQTRLMKRAAADLIWSASAKITRDDRAEVIRRLPALLRLLKDGMAAAGLASEKQEQHIRQLNNSLAAAFTAKAAVIPTERLKELMKRLESIEELLPDVGDDELDSAMIEDISGHESSELEVVAAGGSMPNAAMVSWSKELEVGAWFMLDYRDKNETVQLVWQGMRKQLSLFVTQRGRCVLFPQNRLAAFLQAGLLLPAQDESLTVRATRSAMAKLDVEPARLLS